MMEFERVSTAQSILFSRFATFPKTCYCDNAYNMGRSIILRAPWFNDKCNIICDRFPCKVHICNSVWDPGSDHSCSIYTSYGAESINRLWSLTKAHLRYLNPNNLVP